MIRPAKSFILTLEGVSKSFEGFKAISDLNLYMDEGELRVVIGPNGAGKSTMLDLSTGRITPDKGKIEFGKNTDLTKDAGESERIRKWLEIGMLLAQNPKLLLVDEPAAGMTDEETHKTAELLLSLEGKHSIVVIEHDMTFVRQIARQVTVLHQGSVLCEGKFDEVQSNQKVREVYLGRGKHGNR